MYGISGSWDHIQSRGLERLNREEQRIVSSVLNGLISRAKKRNLPNGSWYRTITVESKKVGHVCGTGCHISTVLDGDMVPNGRKI